MSDVRFDFAAAAGAEGRELMDVLPTYGCWTCRSLSFYRLADGSLVCSQCHPPVSADVARVEAPGPARAWRPTWEWVTGQVEGGA